MFLILRKPKGEFTLFTFHLLFKTQEETEMNTQIIAIANQKGGVGKTTTCANLGIGLAQAGKKVLLIDGDPQGSLTISLGHPQPDKLPFTLSDAMGRILMDEPMRPGDGILHHPEGVDLMPADIQLSGMEVSLVNAMSRETILRQYLDTLKGQYSHILIDCQPSLGMLTVNALAAANRVIIPVQAEYLPAKGLEQLLQTGWTTAPTLPRRLRLCCEKPTAAKSKCSELRFPILSEQRKSVPRARVFLPMTPRAKWPRVTRI